MECRCIADWGQIRRALGISAADFAAIAHISIRSVWNHEIIGPGHHCMLATPTDHVRAYLAPYAPKLAAADIPYPWPEDLALPPEPVVICRVCGQDERRHRRCLGCGFLLGPSHLSPFVLDPNWCFSCGPAFVRTVAAVTG